MENNPDHDRIIQQYHDDIEKSVRHDEQAGNYGYNENWNAEEAGRLQERGLQLDENEAVSKDQYTQNQCEETTGLTADSYRSETVSGMTKEDLAPDVSEEANMRADLEQNMSSELSNENSL